MGREAVVDGTGVGAGMGSQGGYHMVQTVVGRASGREDGDRLRELGGGEGNEGGAEGRTAQEEAWVSEQNHSVPDPQGSNRQ